MSRSTVALAGGALAAILLVLGAMLFDGAAGQASPGTRATRSPSPTVIAAVSPYPTVSPTDAPPPPASTPAMPSDFNGDGFADLAVGVHIDNHTSGAVNVLYGSSAGLTVEGNQYMHRNSHEVPGTHEVSDSFGAALASRDFNRDGYADLAVGAPDDGHGDDAGGVNILFGSAAGLTGADSELWMLADLPGVPAATYTSGGLGHALAAGDFDGDGFADLAIGSPAPDDAGRDRAGVVAVLHGGAEGMEFRGLVLSRGLVGRTTPSEDGAFELVLAAGDLNGDGRDDLAAAAMTAGGRVAVFYGSGSGPTADGSQLWTQDSPGIRGRSSPIDGFGAALAIGDFDGDGFGELAIGAPGEASGCAGTCPHAGAVTVLRGSVAGLTANRSQLWSQRPAEMPGRHEAFDYFGQALAAGDFDGDGQDDLAIGKHGEDWPRRVWERSKGAVTVLYGTSNGLSASRAGRWTQDRPEVPGDAWRGDRFGASLASADFDGDGHDDLAIGAPGERFGHIRFSGLVNVLYGRPTGLDGQAAQEWSRATPGVLGPDPVDWAGGVAFGMVLCP